MYPALALVAPSDLAPLFQRKRTPIQKFPYWRSSRRLMPASKNQLDGNGHGNVGDDSGD